MSLYHINGSTEDLILIKIKLIAVIYISDIGQKTTNSFNGNLVQSWKVFFYVCIFSLDLC